MSAAKKMLVSVSIHAVITCLHIQKDHHNVA